MAGVAFGRARIIRQYVADVGAAALFGTMFGVAVLAGVGLLPPELAVFGLGGGRTHPMHAAVLTMGAVGAVLGCVAAVIVRPGAVVPERVVDEIVTGMDGGDRLRALEACAVDGSALSRIAFEGLSRLENGRARALDAVDDEARAQSLRLATMADLLGTVAKLAPAVGALGFIIHVVNVFDYVSCFGNHRLCFLHGLAVAAVPFAISLVVLVVMTTAEKVFRDRAARLAAEARAVAVAIVEHAAPPHA